MYLHSRLTKCVISYIDNYNFIYRNDPRIMSGKLGIVLLAEGNAKEISSLKANISRLFQVPKKSSYSVEWQGKEIQIDYLKGDEFELTYSSASLKLDVSDFHQLDYLLLFLLNEITPDVYLLKKLYDNRLPINSVLDVGANVGFFSFVSYVLGYEIVAAIEPVSYLYKLKCEDIEYLNIAIGHEKCMADLILSSTHRQGNTLSKEMLEIFPNVFGSDPKVIKIEMNKIDNLFSNKIGIIKVDVEGFEKNVIKGGECLLKNKMIGCLLVESYDRYIADLHSICSTYFDYKYAMCEQDNDIRLVPIGQDISLFNFLKRSIPPTYLYSNFEINF